MKLIYPGPHPAVDVPAAGVTAIKGEPVEIADDIAARLLEQGWSKTPRASKKESS